MNSFDVLVPETKEDVIDLLTSKSANAALLAGGTDLLPLVREGKKQPDQQIGDQFKGNIDQRAEKTKQSDLVHDHGNLGLDENRGTAGKDDQYRTDEHDGQVIVEFSP